VRSEKENGDKKKKKNEIKKNHSSQNADELRFGRSDSGDRADKEKKHRRVFCARTRLTNPSTESNGFGLGTRLFFPLNFSFFFFFFHSDPFDRHDLRAYGNGALGCRARSFYTLTVVRAQLVHDSEYGNRSAGRDSHSAQTILLTRPLQVRAQWLGHGFRTSVGRGEGRSEEGKNHLDNVHVGTRVARKRRISDATNRFNSK
jgi:hypothetical protein